MEVIDFRGTKQIMHDGDNIIKVHVGNELMWKLVAKLTRVYNRDEVDLEGLRRTEMTLGSLYLDGYLVIVFITETPIKYIEVNNQFIKVLDGEEIRDRKKSTIEIDRFNKLQAEKLFGITVEGEFIEFKGLVDIYGWH